MNSGRQRILSDEELSTNSYQHSLQSEDVGSLKFDQKVRYRGYSSQFSLNNEILLSIERREHYQPHDSRIVIEVDLCSGTQTDKLSDTSLVKLEEMGNSDAWINRLISYDSFVDKDIKQTVHDDVLEPYKYQVTSRKIRSTDSISIDCKDNISNLSKTLRNSETQYTPCFLKQEELDNISDNIKPVVLTGRNENEKLILTGNVENEMEELITNLNKYIPKHGNYNNSKPLKDNDPVKEIETVLPNYVRNVFKPLELSDEYNEPVSEKKPDKINETENIPFVEDPVIENECLESLPEKRGTISKSLQYYLPVSKDDSLGDKEELDRESVSTEENDKSENEEIAVIDVPLETLPSDDEISPEFKTVDLKSGFDNYSADYPKKKTVVGSNLIYQENLVVHIHSPVMMEDVVLSNVSEKMGKLHNASKNQNLLIEPQYEVPVSKQPVEDFEPESVSYTLDTGKYMKTDHIKSPIHKSDLNFRTFLKDRSKSVQEKDISSKPLLDKRKIFETPPKSTVLRLGDSIEDIFDMVSQSPIKPRREKSIKLKKSYSLDIDDRSKKPDKSINYDGFVNVTSDKEMPESYEPDEDQFNIEFNNPTFAGNVEILPNNDFPSDRESYGSLLMNKDQFNAEITQPSFSGNTDVLPNSDFSSDQESSGSSMVIKTAVRQPFSPNVSSLPISNKGQADDNLEDIFDRIAHSSINPVIAKSGNVLRNQPVKCDWSTRAPVTTVKPEITVPQNSKPEDLSASVSSLSENQESSSGSSMIITHDNDVQEIEIVNPTFTKNVNYEFNDREIDQDEIKTPVPRTDEPKSNQITQNRYSSSDSDSASDTDTEYSESSKADESKQKPKAINYEKKPVKKLPSNNTTSGGVKRVSSSGSSGSSSSGTSSSTSDSKSTSISSLRNHDQDKQMPIIIDSRHMVQPEAPERDNQEILPNNAIGKLSEKEVPLSDSNNKIKRDSSISSSISSVSVSSSSSSSSSSSDSSTSTTKAEDTKEEIKALPNNGIVEVSKKEVPLSDSNNKIKRDSSVSSAISSSVLSSSSSNRSASKLKAKDTNKKITNPELNSIDREEKFRNENLKPQSKLQKKENEVKNEKGKQSSSSSSSETEDSSSDSSDSSEGTSTAHGSDNKLNRNNETKLQEMKPLANSKGSLDSKSNGSDFNRATEKEKPIQGVNLKKTPSSTTTSSYTSGSSDTDEEGTSRRKPYVDRKEMDTTKDVENKRKMNRPPRAGNNANEQLTSSDDSSSSESESDTPLQKQQPHIDRKEMDETKDYRNIRKLNKPPGAGDKLSQSESDESSTDESEITSSNYSDKEKNQQVIASEKIEVIQNTRLKQQPQVDRKEVDEIKHYGNRKKLNKPPETGDKLSQSQSDESSPDESEIGNSDFSNQWGDKKEDQQMIAPERVELVQKVRPMYAGHQLPESPNSDTPRRLSPEEKDQDSKFMNKNKDVRLSRLKDRIYDIPYRSRSVDREEKFTSLERRRRLMEKTPKTSYSIDRLEKFTDQEKHRMSGEPIEPIYYNCSTEDDISTNLSQFDENEMDVMVAENQTKEKAEVPISYDTTTGLQNGVPNKFHDDDDDDVSLDLSTNTLSTMSLNHDDRPQNEKRRTLPVPVIDREEDDIRQKYNTLSHLHNNNSLPKDNKKENNDYVERKFHEFTETWQRSSPIDVNKISTKSDPKKKSKGKGKGKGHKRSKYTLVVGPFTTRPRPVPSYLSPVNVWYSKYPIYSDESSSDNSHYEDEYEADNLDRMDNSDRYERHRSIPSNFQQQRYYENNKKESRLPTVDLDYGDGGGVGRIHSNYPRSSPDGSYLEDSVILGNQKHRPVMARPDSVDTTVSSLSNITDQLINQERLNPNLNNHSNPSLVSTRTSSTTLNSDDYIQPNSQPQQFGARKLIGNNVPQQQFIPSDSESSEFSYTTAEDESEGNGQGQGHEQRRTMINGKLKNK